MASQNITISATNGIHARPAGVFVSAAKTQPASVTLTAPSGTTALGTSILAIIGLGLQNGDIVTLSSEGEGADETVATLSEVLAGSFE